MGKNESKKSFGDEVHEKFFIITNKNKNGNEEEKKQAKMEAIELLEDFIHATIKSYTWFPDYEDIVQEAKIAIIENLENYNPNISKPTTYFKKYIAHSAYEYMVNKKE